jgi:hypothetical protein
MLRSIVRWQVSQKTEAISDIDRRAWNVDVNKILLELRQEREQIEDAIISLERLARGRGKRRGRPPAWMKDAQDRKKVRAAKGKDKDDE